MSNFSAFPEIQEAAKEIMRGKFNVDLQSESYRFILGIMHFCVA